MALFEINKDKLNYIKEEKFKLRNNIGRQHLGGYA